MLASYRLLFPATMDNDQSKKLPIYFIILSILYFELFGSTSDNNKTPEYISTIQASATANAALSKIDVDIFKNLLMDYDIDESVKYLAIAIIAIENYSRPPVFRFFETNYVRASYYITGALPNATIGVGQICVTKAIPIIRSLIDPTGHLQISECISSVAQDYYNIQIAFILISEICDGNNIKCVNDSNMEPILKEYNGQVSDNYNSRFYNNAVRQCFNILLREHPALFQPDLHRPTSHSG